MTGTHGLHGSSHGNSRSGTFEHSIASLRRSTVPFHQRPHRFLTSFPHLRSGNLRHQWKYLPTAIYTAWKIGAWDNIPGGFSAWRCLVYYIASVPWYFPWRYYLSEKGQNKLRLKIPFYSFRKHTIKVVIILNNFLKIAENFV